MVLFGEKVLESLPRRLFSQMAGQTLIVSTVTNKFYNFHTRALRNAASTSLASLST